MSKSRFFKLIFYAMWPWTWPSHLIYVILLTLAFVSWCFDLHIVAVAFSETLLNQTKNCKQIDENRNNSTFGYRRISDLDLHIYIVPSVWYNLKSCCYYLYYYIKGFIYIYSGHITKFCYKLWLNYCFFAFFENVPFLTLPLTFIFIICLGFDIDKIYFFLYNHISFFIANFSYTKDLN